MKTKRQGKLISGEEWVKQLTELLRLAGILDFGNKPEFTTEDGIFLATDNGGRGQKLTIVFQGKEDEIAMEEDLLDLAKKVFYSEEFGFVDLDGITCNFQIGHNFHGIPDEILDIFNGRLKDNEDFNTTWLTIEWIDWAS